ncbi:MAG: beta-ketoacyl-ACP synthase II [Abditibacteriota bacterium]|nr:beta-ketoacyl-ACP synthase II [Abditibacteriota bacterium]
MSEKRVVVTGIGLLTPLGSDIETYWDGLVNCRNGIGQITHFDASEHRCRIAAQINDFDAEKYLPVKIAKRTDRYAQFAASAALMAVEDSGLVIDDENASRIGVLIGSGIGGVETWEKQTEVLAGKGPLRVSPFFVPMLISNMASGVTAILTGAKGPNMAVVTACATACHSIGESYRMIQRGDADAMLCGGAEAAIRPLSCAGFSSMKAFSFRNDDPEHASRPFDRDRDGFVMGEGSGVLLLEDYGHAVKRGAKIYAELIGYGCSADACDMVAINKDGARRSMLNALKSAGVNADEIDYINAHGTSTPLGDAEESSAIELALGEEAAKKTCVSSTKSMIGHLLGAAGAVESIACIKTLQTGVIHPTRNLYNVGDSCHLDYVPLTAREKKVRIAMKNSFGFGGQNATLIWKKI